jgi:hypothetical protein
VTGCKSPDEGVQVTKRIYEKLDSIRHLTDNILLTKDVNGVLLDKDNLVYAYKNYQVIGHKRDDGLYIINKKEFEINSKTSMFISRKMETKRRRIILNFDGEEIGCSRIELLKNKNKFYKKNTNIYFDYTHSLIYYNNDLIIGKIVLEVDTSKMTSPDDSPDILEVEYKCNPFVETEYRYETETSCAQAVSLNVNCINVYFNINFVINRQRLYDKLIDLNYICKYKPESYSGIRMVFKIPLKLEGNCLVSQFCSDTTLVGQCICSNKCTCVNITFLIFQSGNVIATGFKSIEQITYATNSFIKLCQVLQTDVQKQNHC